MKKGLMVAGIVVLVLTSLSGGYLYAAQGGVSAQDKKQLGLFNGNGEFMGAILNIEFGNSTIYTIYNPSIDSTFALQQQYIIDPINSEYVATEIFFESPNCSGAAFFNADPSFGQATFMPQIVYVLYNPITRWFRTGINAPSVQLVQSHLLDDGTCVNASDSRLAVPANEISLPFSLVTPLHIEPL